MPPLRKNIDHGSEVSARCRCHLLRFLGAWTIHIRLYHKSCVIYVALTKPYLSYPTWKHEMNWSLRRVTEWKNDTRIDLREFELKDEKLIPTKKGISLPLIRWKMLVESFDDLDKALVEKKDHSSHLGGKRILIRTSRSCLCKHKTILVTSKWNRGSAYQKRDHA